MLRKGVDGPIGLIRRDVDIRPRLLNEFDQTTPRDAAPLALEGASVSVALCARGLGGISAEEFAGFRSCGWINASEFCLETNPF